ncbi:MAG: hypothetical protein PSV13_01230 [Lacunisphaera sp.]|nr:hypothetical protein [Lacunisphaera sp.]
MFRIPHFPFWSASCTTFLGVIALAAVLAAPVVGRAASDWKTSTSLTLRESYDSNVFLQDQAPNPAVIGAAPARLGSLVTSLAAALGWEKKQSALFGITASYAPEAVRFHSASTEDHFIHRTALSFGGAAGGLSWSLTNSGIWTDGSVDAPIFGGPGGAPAIGGTPVRDRREAFVDRSSFKLSYTTGRWLVRAVAAGYWHDFRTNQTTLTGCSNYIDRNEVTGGVEAGYALAPKTRLIAGFRYGRQNQFRSLGVDSPYDSQVRRFVAGLEGSPRTWLQLNLLAGLDTRTFAAGTPAGFDRSRARLWVDASATATPTKRDTIQFSLRRSALPSSSSVSLYEDTAGELSWRHQCNDRFSVKASFRICAADWAAPAVRRDRIYSPGLQLQYVCSPRLTAEATYNYDRGESLIAATAGREFHHHLVALGLKQAF